MTTRRKFTDLIVDNSPSSTDIIMYTKDPSGTPVSRSTTISGLAAASGATTALDNLASVAVNTDITSDTDSTDSLGTTVKKWLKGFFDSISLGEVAAAPADVAGDGQVWVKSDTPNNLYFTNDVGTDTKLNNIIGTDVLAEQTIGIADNNLLEVDGSPNDDEYARFTANGLEGRIESEFKADFNLEIGTDVLAEQTIGIADNNLLEVDQADAASGEYAKFTANGIESKSVAEAQSDLSIIPLTTIDAKGDLLGGTAADTISKLAVGTNDHVLTADSGEATGMKWAAAPGGGAVATDAIWDAKGDLAGGTGADTASKLTVGTNNHVLTADSGEATGMKWAASAGGSSMSNSNISPTTGDQTATVNTRYFADLSGLTAERNFVLPAGTVGDVVILSITTGDASYEYVIKGDTGITINGGSAATEWSRVFITGEGVTLVADTTSNWQIVSDDRIPVQCRMYANTGGGTWNSGAQYTPDYDSTDVNVGGCADLTNDRFTIRRAGTYSFGASGLSGVISSTTNYCTGRLINDTPTTIHFSRNVYYSSRAFIDFSSTISVTMAYGYITPTFQQESENTTFLGGVDQHFSITEVL